MENNPMFVKLTESIMSKLRDEIDAYQDQLKQETLESLENRLKDCDGN